MYVVFLAMVAAVPALATDMYLAAIPGIAQQWGCPESRVHLSLIFWFLSFCVFLLVWGPVSDKYGRRPVLVGWDDIFCCCDILVFFFTECYGAGFVSRFSGDGRGGSFGDVYGHLP